MDSAWARRGRGGATGVDLWRDGPGFVVSGPSGSGRSTALATLALGLLARGTPVALVASTRSPLRGLAHLPGVLATVDGTQGDTLAAALVAEAVVLADDAEWLTDTPVGDLLTGRLRRDGASPVVVAGRGDDLATTFRGVTVEARRSGAGLLLCPGQAEGDLLRVRLPRGPAETTPGRGVLVTAGRPTRIQVALPPEPAAAGSRGPETQPMWGYR